MINIDIANEYTKTPGARYISDGDFSGQDFREKFLEKHFKNGSKEKITVILDGVMGYATSFLEESFGGLVRKFGDKYSKNDIFERFDFISNEEPACRDEIRKYIFDAKFQK